MLSAVCFCAGIFARMGFDKPLSLRDTSSTQTHLAITLPPLYLVYLLLHAADCNVAAAFRAALVTRIRRRSSRTIAAGAITPPWAECSTWGRSKSSMRPSTSTLARRRSSSRSITRRERLVDREVYLEHQFVNRPEAALALKTKARDLLSIPKLIYGKAYLMESACKMLILTGELVPLSPSTAEELIREFLGVSYRYQRPRSITLLLTLPRPYIFSFFRITNRIFL